MRLTLRPGDLAVLYLWEERLFSKHLFLLNLLQIVASANSTDNEY